MTDTVHTDLISVHDLSRSNILALLERALTLKTTPPGPILHGRVLGSCFFEPSTRTRLSVETAMQRLGGTVIGFADPTFTSQKKGETLSDTMRMIDGYADIIAIRHPLEGAARLASDVCAAPVVNAGDGANQHPTQTLIDLFTILEQFQTIDGLHITLVGDLKYGRTVHSLIHALRHFRVTITLVSPPELRLPEAERHMLIHSHIPFEETTAFHDALLHTNVLYMTRLQEERFADKSEFALLSKQLALTPAHLKKANTDLIILHPLPRITEIDPGVDVLPQARYFTQAKNGIPVRQAVITTLLHR